MVDHNIKEIFLNIFDDDNITFDTSIHNYEKWDSLCHAKIIVALEKKFGIKFSFSEITLFTRVKNIQEYLSKKGLIQC